MGLLHGLMQLKTDFPIIMPPVLSLQEASAHLHNITYSLKPTHIPVHFVLSEAVCMTTITYGL